MLVFQTDDDLTNSGTNDKRKWCSFRREIFANKSEADKYFSTFANLREEKRKSCARSNKDAIPIAFFRPKFPTAAFQAKVTIHRPIRRASEIWNRNAKQKINERGKRIFTARRRARIRWIFPPRDENNGDAIRNEIFSRRVRGFANAYGNSPHGCAFLPFTLDGELEKLAIGERKRKFSSTVCLLSFGREMLRSCRQITFTGAWRA